jgi:hypothetical protein
MPALWRGFGKKNGKEEVEVGQLKADKEALESRVNTLVELYQKEHPEPKPWYTSPGVWFAFLCTLAVLYLVYVFVRSEGGMPAVYDFLSKIGL